MEIEYKLKIKNENQYDDIWSYICSEAFQQAEKPEEKKMLAIYLDTAENDLGKKNIALRKRSENSDLVLTVKWASKSADNGLSERQEVNLPLSDDSEAEMLKAIESIDLADLKSIAHSSKLCSIVETRFVRKLVKIKYNESIIELAVDKGEIIAAGKTLPILELEAELYEGTVEDLMRCTEILTNHFNLKPELKSKYARGIGLLG